MIRREEIKTIQYEPKVVNILDLFTEWEKEGKSPNKLLFAASKEQIDEIYRDMKKNAIENVAMGNAIPQLKKKADFIIKTNNEAGIAYALEEMLWR